MHSPEDARRIAQSLVERGIAAGAERGRRALRRSALGQRAGAPRRARECEPVRRGGDRAAAVRRPASATVASSDLSDESLAVLVDRCLAMAGEAPEDPFAGLAPQRTASARRAPAARKRGRRDPDPQELRERALEAEQAALGGRRGDQFERRRGERFGNDDRTRYVRRFFGRLSSTGHSCSASVIAGEGANMQRDHAWHSARYLEDLEGPAEIGRRAGERAVARLGATRPKPGRYPVLFDPRVSSTLLGHFAGAITGSSIARKTSFLQDKLGAAVFGDGVTIVDDPLRLRGHALAAVRCRRLARVAAGARVQRACSTAGSRRALRRGSWASRRLAMRRAGPAARPRASPSNLYMEAGHAKPRRTACGFSRSACW